MLVEEFDELDSTSLHARRLVESGRASERGGGGARLIVAATQTDGLGRLGRAWMSPRGGLWLTLMWPMRGDLAAVTEGLGLRIGVACVRAIDGMLAGRGAAQLRWPNDVLIGGRKVLGVLTETMQSGEVSWVLVGVGVNANFGAGELPPGLRREPATLRDVLGGPVDLTGLCDAIVQGLAGALRGRGVGAEELVYARLKLYGVGGEVSVRGGSGVLLGLGEDGRPQVRMESGEVVSGEAE